MNEIIEKIIKEKDITINKMKDEMYFSQLVEIGHRLSTVISQGGKLYIAGNGGSAADAQHFAAELVGRFLIERDSLPAISLCVDPSVITAISNDYGFENVFSRQIDSLCKKEDCLFIISTSGNSKNLINAVNVANNNNALTIGLLGKDGGILKTLCDYNLIVPSMSTPRIQEFHTLSIHILCELIENTVYTKNYKGKEV